MKRGREVELHGPQGAGRLVVVAAGVAPSDAVIALVARFDLHVFRDLEGEREHERNAIGVHGLSPFYLATGVKTDLHGRSVSAACSYCSNSW